MKFTLTRAARNHTLIAIIISDLAFFLGQFIGETSALLLAAGALFYLGRELRDREKVYAWDVSKWNSAELLLPVVSNALLVALALFMMHGN